MSAATVFDVETDAIGLRDISKLHCMASMGIGDTEATLTTSVPAMGRVLDDSGCVIGHNIIAYDLRVLEQVFGFTIRPDLVVIDTMVLSNYVWVDRSKSHSIENLAKYFKLGESKIKITDFSAMTPELGERCCSDVRLNRDIFKRIVQGEMEMGMLNLINHMMGEEDMAWGRISRRGLSASGVTGQ